jgi:methyl-accepting chemotaxis protein-1 (serine sensor receptor)
MKLATKLPLAFAAALLVLLGAALFGIAQLRQALTTYQTTVAVHADQERAVNHMLDSFKLQTQEWKNVLLRGRTRRSARYWSAFEKQEAVVQEAAPLLAGLPAGDSRSRVEGFAQAHQRMGQAYRSGYQAFQAAGMDAVAGTRRCRASTGNRPGCWMRPVR